MHAATVGSTLSSVLSFVLVQRKLKPRLSLSELHYDTRSIINYVISDVSCR